MAHEANPTGLPGSELKSGKMPSHWLLARLGKRVLRHGGLELTRTLLSDLAIGDADDVVELAPGLGVTPAFSSRRVHAATVASNATPTPQDGRASSSPGAMTSKFVSARPSRRDCPTAPQAP